APSFFSTEASPPVTSPLSLHDALPICLGCMQGAAGLDLQIRMLQIIVQRRIVQSRQQNPAHGGAIGRQPSAGLLHLHGPDSVGRSEEHTSELQSRENLVCRLLLEKKKQ